jgi:hypothetical protein
MSRSKAILRAIQAVSVLMVCFSVAVAPASAASTYVYDPFTESNFGDWDQAGGAVLNGNCVDFSGDMSTSLLQELPMIANGFTVHVAYQSTGDYSDGGYDAIYFVFNSAKTGGWVGSYLGDYSGTDYFGIAVGHVGTTDEYVEDWAANDPMLNGLWHIWFVYDPKAKLLSEYQSATNDLSAATLVQTMPADMTTLSGDSPVSFAIDTYSPDTAMTQEVCAVELTIAGEASAVPEASTVALVVSGGVGLAGYIGLQWRARRRAGK